MVAEEYILLCNQLVVRMPIAMAFQIFVIKNCQNKVKHSKLQKNTHISPKIDICWWWNNIFFHVMFVKYPFLLIKKKKIFCYALSTVFSVSASKENAKLKPSLYCFAKVAVNKSWFMTKITCRPIICFRCEVYSDMWSCSRVYCFVCQLQRCVGFTSFILQTSSQRYSTLHLAWVW